MTSQGGYEAGRRVSLPLVPDPAFAVNDHVALGIIRPLAEEGVHRRRTHGHADPRRAQAGERLVTTELFSATASRWPRMSFGPTAASRGTTPAIGWPSRLRHR
ncbi:MAG: hypothetical protein ACYC1E_00115 [Propionibacteriaceae bacterium]